MPPLDSLVAQLTNSAVFRRSRRHAELLQFLARLQNSGSEIKETVIGADFFGREADYNPKADPVVRIEIRRLRERLAEYYATEGASDPVRLEIPRGSYRVIAVERDPPAAATPQPAVAATPLPAPLPHRFSLRLWMFGGGAVLCLALGWIAVRSFNRPLESIAVLPLKTTGSSDPALGTVVSGGITNVLARAEGLRVVGPEGAARALKDGDEDPFSVARALSVAAVVSGEIASDGKRLRVHVRVNRASDRKVLWAGTVERDLVDLFTTEDDVSRNVAAAIHRELLKGEGSKPRQAVPEATLAYQRGIRLLERRSAPSIRDAIAQFRRAVEIDPNYIEGWAALTNALVSAPDYYSPTPGWAAEVRAAGAKTLALDPGNSDAYSALGWVAFEETLYLNEARRNLEKAVALNPNHVDSQRRLGLVLTFLGQHEAAEQHLRTALRLDPLSPIAQVNLAEMYQYRGDYENEIRQLREVLKSNPNFAVAQIMLAGAEAHSGACPQALAEADRLQANPDSEGWRGPIATIRAQCGDPAMAQQMWDSGATDQREWVALGLGKWDTVRRWLARCIEQWPSTALIVAKGPDSPVLRKDPVIARWFDDLEARIRRP